ncbi:RnfABCDGE type electron transport complex subunit G [Salidesulfovibrio onnuriiensis]|uniref:RnfABCDGE type electron transport complex subunit G n=1 Tax=Salidesulfovibrio onnuriiensis TaxID=2583823 RepID=UPI0011C794AB|nr:FMN-binding protein [Salidesulfovibrio onnuriiensis]
MKEMIKMVVVLSLICSLSGLTLASVRKVTKPFIEEQVLTYVQGPAIAQVFSDYDNNPVKDRKSFALENGSELTVFPFLKNGKLDGVAFESFARGFGGDIGVMVGFSYDPTSGKSSLSSIGVTTMKETPGVGTRISGPDFGAQFKGHSLEGVNLASKGGDINAIAGATISSTGAVDAVKQAVAQFNEIKDKLPTAWGS